MTATQVGTGGAATLLVAWRTTRRVHGHVVRAGTDVIEELRRSAVESAELIAGGPGRPYTPDDEQGDAPFLTVERDELLDTDVVDVLTTGASLPLAAIPELRRTLAFYALLLGNDPNRRSAFIKKGNPVKLADKGLIAIFDQTLTRVTQPILSFSPTFDVVIAPEGVWAFDQKNFEGLFKETDVVLAKTDEWVEELSVELPIAEYSKKEFAERLRSNSVLRRKVQSILRNPHFKNLTPAVIRHTMKAHGLDPDRLMPDGELVFDKETEKDVLHLLNEDLFTGDFSGQHYAASRKARRA
jgi:hypothetical protein